jgi:hypothetical protein
VADPLEKLLQNPRLWRGREQTNTSTWQGLPSGYPKLDRHLPGGGWPQHALTEILLEHYGMGELQLLKPALARLSTPEDWSAEQALSSGNCAAVLMWLDTMDDYSSRRLQLAAEKGQSWAIAFRPLAALSKASAAALRIQLMPGEKGTDLGILKSRGGRPAVLRNYAD